MSNFCEENIIKINKKYCKIRNKNKTTPKDPSPIITVSHAFTKNNQSTLNDDVDDVTKRMRRIVLFMNTVAIVLCMALLINRSSICIDRYVYV